MAPRPVPTIKQVCSSGNCHLLVDSNNSLWVMGSNKHWRLGVQPESTIAKPRSLGIRLDAGECVSKFHVNQRLTAIYTSGKRLFIAHLVSPVSLSARVSGIDVSNGTYLYPAIDTFTSTELNWPTPPMTEPIAPYVRTKQTDLPDLSDLFGDLDPKPVSKPVAKPAAKGKQAAKSVPKQSSPPVSSPVSVLGQPVSAPEPDNTCDFGTDPLALCESSSHDFGLGKHLDSLPDMLCGIGDLIGAVFAKKAGFNEPLTAIDEVTMVAESVFFRKGSSVFVYNWRLTPKIIMAGNGGLAFSPCQHTRAFTYYQILMPFIPDTIEFRENNVYMRLGSMHHVLTSFRRAAIPWLIVSWLYFPFEKLDPDSIYISTKMGQLYVKTDMSVLLYIHLFKSLRLVIQDRKPFMITRTDYKAASPCCLRADGALLEYVSKKVFCQPDPWLKNTITISCSLEPPFIVLVDVKGAERFRVKGDTLLINVNNCRYAMRANRFPILVDAQNAVFVYANKLLEVPHMKLEKQFVVSDRTHRIYKWLNTPKPIDSFNVGAEWITIESKGKHYRGIIDSTFRQVQAIQLELVKRIPATVIKDLVKRKTSKAGTRVEVQIETFGNLFERLCSFAEMFGKDIMLKPDYTLKSVTVSNGLGIKRVFAQDALSQFAMLYLIIHGACSEYNIEALSKLTPPQLFIIGRALHMAMYMNRTCLSVRMPISFLAALLNREPEIDELEFFLQQESPDVYDTITGYFDDPSGLEECGYTSYEECLKYTCFYQHADPEIDQRAKHISHALALGFNSFAEVDNIKKMNMPTIDHYVSGAYCIDRVLLISKLDCSHAILLKFVRNLIERLPEDKLAIFLRNWTGSSVYKGTKCTVLEIAKRDVEFATCGRKLHLNPAIFQKGNKDAIAELVDLLTTPESSIKN